MSFFQNKRLLGLTGNSIYPRFEGKIIDIELELQFRGMLEAKVKSRCEVCLSVFDSNCEEESGMRNEEFPPYLTFVQCHIQLSLLDAV